MNRLWVRISLTFVGVVFFLIAIPLTIALTTNLLAGAESEQTVELTSTENSTTTTNPVNDNPRTSIRIFSFLRFLVSVALLGTAVGVISTRGLTAPLNKLVEAAKAVGAKNLSQRVDVKGTEEIKAVAQAFNEMAADLERAEAMRTNLLNDVAHELRTPITVIQGNLRAILDDVYELDKAEIARLYDQTRHLARLVDDLRDLAQAEAKQLPLNLTNVNAGEWVQETAAAFRPISAEKNITVHVEIPGEPLQIMADQARLTQCLQNLLNNALQHTPTGGKINIQVDPTPDGLSLRVQDTGEGIEAQHLPYLFDRFYRTDPARSREAGGTGLGLAITRSFIEAHGGTINVTSEGIGKGSTFTILLPIQPR